MSWVEAGIIAVIIVLVVFIGLSVTEGVRDNESVIEVEVKPEDDPRLIRTNLSLKVRRVEDLDAGVVCWRFSSDVGIAASCLPRTSTYLDRAMFP